MLGLGEVAIVADESAKRGRALSAEARRVPLPSDPVLAAPSASIEETTCYRELSDQIADLMTQIKGLQPNRMFIDQPPPTKGIAI